LENLSPFPLANFLILDGVYDGGSPPVNASQIRIGLPPSTLFTSLHDAAVADVDSTPV